MVNEATVGQQRPRVGHGAAKMQLKKKSTLELEDQKRYGK